MRNKTFITSGVTGNESRRWPPGEALLLFFIVVSLLVILKQPDEPKHVLMFNFVHGFRS